MLEKEIQNEIVDYLKQNRIFFFQNYADGLPDIIICYKGRFIGLELKKPKTGRAQGHQKIISKEIRKSGGISAFPTSLTEVKRILKKIDAEEHLCR